MSSANKINLMNSLSSKDTGDDMQRRIKYQHLVSVYYALLMYMGKIEISEIFCEHHEDIIGAVNNDDFIGMQVKTKARNLGPNKLNDEAIKSSLLRFIELDREYSQFSRFIIISNNAFLEDNTAFSIKTLKQQITIKQNVVDPPKLEKYIISLSENAGCTRQEVIDVLNKTEFIDLPDFDELRPKIITDILPLLGECKDMVVEQYDSILDALTTMVYKASSKTMASSIHHYVHLMSGKAADNIAQAEINIKRITKKQIQEVLQNPQYRMFLLSSGDLNLSPHRKKLLDIKMNTGMIDQDEIVNLNDLRDDCERYFLEKFERESTKEKSMQKFSHIKSIVKNESVEAKIHTKRADRPYGEDMLGEIESRLREICKLRAAELDYCPYEILKGLVGSLAGECLIQFSETPKGGWHYEE